MDGSHDKTKAKDDYEWGWNDPPSLSYSTHPTGVAGSTTGSRPPPNLQQRVYHSTNQPATATTTTTSSSSASSQPHPPQQGPASTLSSTMAPPTGNYLGHTPSTARPSAKEDSSTKDGEDADQEETAAEGPDLAFVMLQLETTLGDHEGSLQGRVVEDVRKKLSIFSQQWRDEKLSLAVRSKMHSLAQAMAESDFSKAHEIHVSLIVDYSGEVSQWMVGVKKIISVAMQKK